jgi:hypothetical protein
VIRCGSPSKLGVRASFPALFLLLVVTPAFGGSNTTFNFLRNDVGARAASLAGSFVSVTGDPNGLFYNPATLATLDERRGSIGFFKHILDINSGSASYGGEIEGIGFIGAGIIYTNYGTFTETDEAGNELGSFSAGDLALVAGYASQIQENLFWGGNLKFIYSSIAGYRSSGIAGDAGLLFIIPESHASLGVSIRNLGIQLSKYLSTSEELPLDVTLGGSIIPRGLPLLLNLNFHRLNDKTSSFLDRFRAFSLGGEFTISKVVQLRVGFDNATRKDLSVGTTPGLAGFSSGLGITAGLYKIDYGITLLGKIGNFHRISLATTL